MVQTGPKNFTPTHIQAKYGGSTIFGSACKGRLFFKYVNTHAMLLPQNTDVCMSG